MFNKRKRILQDPDSFVLHLLTLNVEKCDLQRLPATAVGDGGRWQQLPLSCVPSSRVLLLGLKIGTSKGGQKSPKGGSVHKPCSPCELMSVGLQILHLVWNNGVCLTKLILFWKMENLQGSDKVLCC